VVILLTVVVVVLVSFGSGPYLVELGRVACVLLLPVFSENCIVVFLVGVRVVSVFVQFPL
jgi:hypothetical protein